jgi:siroheme synthase
LPLACLQEALQYAPATAEAVYVGKRGGRASFKQPAIDQLLVEYVQQVGLFERVAAGAVCAAVQDCKSSC